MADQSKLKARADDQINGTKKIETVFEKSRKHCGKRKNGWLPTLFPFLTMLSKVSFSGLSFDE